RWPCASSSEPPTPLSGGSTGMATLRPSSASSGWCPGAGAVLPERFLDGTVTIRAARPRGKTGEAAGEVNGHAAIDLEGRHELRDGRHPGALVPGDGELEQGLVQPALSRAPEPDQEQALVRGGRPRGRVGRRRARLRI